MKLTPVQKLTRRLAEQGHAASASTFKRTYAGRHQKAAGGWVWSMRSLDGMREYGSLWSVTALLKAPKIVIQQAYSFSDLELFPEE